MFTTQLLFLLLCEACSPADYCRANWDCLRRNLPIEHFHLSEFGDWCWSHHLLKCPTMLTILASYKWPMHNIYTKPVQEPQTEQLNDWQGENVLELTNDLTNVTFALQPKPSWLNWLISVITVDLQHHWLTNTSNLTTITQMWSVSLLWLCKPLCPLHFHWICNCLKMLQLPHGGTGMLVHTPHKSFRNIANNGLLQMLIKIKILFSWNNLLMQALIR